MTANGRDPTMMMCPEIGGDVRVCVPADISLLTPYVLLEQDDWFEDEIHFVRRFLEQGMNVVDIGANYGVYTLSAARIVGSTGRVTSFEPSSRCRSFLSESLKSNGFEQVTVVAAALGDSPGQAQLALLDNPELGELSESQQASATTETVDVVTLDQSAVALGLRDIHFVKLDAEGYETRIIAGGRHFFSTQSPLVMYERVHGAVVDATITDAMRGLGYSTYCLVPGLMLLVPATEDMVKEFQPLNLFACKPDTAGRLQERGLLISKVEDSGGGEISGVWRGALYAMPYTQNLQTYWEGFAQKYSQTEYWEILDKSLDAYFSARDVTLERTRRYYCLRLAYDLFRRLASSHPNFASLQCLARVSIELGSRSVATRCLGLLVEEIWKGDPVDLHGPFITPSARFEGIAPGLHITQWLHSSIIESFEQIRAYSSYFSPEPGLVQALRDFGFMGASMARRLQLMRLRSDRQREPEPEDKLVVYDKDNRNPGFWKRDSQFFYLGPR
jgi:FkbM family methyltransferase